MSALIDRTASPEERTTVCDVVDRVGVQHLGHVVADARQRAKVDLDEAESRRWSSGRRPARGAGR